MPPQKHRYIYPISILNVEHRRVMQFPVITRQPAEVIRDRIEVEISNTNGETRDIYDVWRGILNIA